MKDKNFIDLIKHFIRRLELLDIWTDMEMWRIIEVLYKELMNLKEYVYKDEIDINILKFSSREMWRKLNILGRNYEELCREWFLPSMLSSLASYNK